MSKKWLNSKEFKMLMECPFYVYDEEEYAGIYVIMNEENGKVYVGQSKDVFERIDEHKSRLRNNKHHNIYLQRSWNRYGEENFSFHTVEFCYFKDLMSSLMGIET